MLTTLLSIYYLKLTLSTLIALHMFHLIIFFQYIFFLHMYNYLLCVKKQVRIP